MIARHQLLIAVACCAGAAASCAGDDETATRLVVAVDVEVSDDVGGWTVDAPGSDLCTFEDPDAFEFTVTDDSGENVLLEPYSSEARAAMPLGAFSGEVVDGACANLLVLDVSTTEPVTVQASFAGEVIDSMRTTAIETEAEAGLAGRRSEPSPWRLRK